MLDRVRLRLSLLYLAVAVVLLALLGAGTYALVARYFQTTIDAALHYKMRFEFGQLDAPLPSSLQVATLAASQSTLVAPSGLSDSSELAAIYVLPLDPGGRVLFNPNTFALPAPPDPVSVQAAAQHGADLRTIQLSDRSRIRLLTYRLTRSDGPALLQVGRSLRGQDEVLQRLLLGLLAVGAGGVALLGWTSWWLAGRWLATAQQAWQRQQTFIANASHELRAPLTLLRASAEVAGRSYPATATQRLLLDDVLHEADHMTLLIENLLLLGRLDAQQQPLKREIITLAPLLTDLERQFGRLAAEQHTSLEVAASGNVWADRTALWQVLLIVIDNALSHTAPGGTVRITTGPPGRMQQLIIADTGTGIAAEHLPHLFDRFYRVDNARTTERRGSGLGLAIAQALIEAQGGEIKIASTLNVGTTVTITLPSA